jgi:two-component system chemotaxis response regulator CheB
MPRRDIVVVGSSAGGVEALQTLVGGLPVEFPAAVFIVQHLPPHRPTALPQILQRATELSVSRARYGERIVSGRIYVAGGDQHLLLDREAIRLGAGPRQHNARPAIDPLFQSAALAFGNRVIGVVLTGMLADGAAGMAAIRRAGGVTLVQDPEEAQFSDMPQSALDALDGSVDGVLPLKQLTVRLCELAGAPVVQQDLPPDWAGSLREAIGAMDGEREPVRGWLGCPTCGGPLSERSEPGLERFRCHVGHGFSTDALVAAQTDEVERALWSAVRLLDEKAALFSRLAGKAATNGRSRALQNFLDRSEIASEHSTAIRTLLGRLNDEGEARDSS